MGPSHTAMLPEAPGTETDQHGPSQTDQHGSSRTHQQGPRDASGMHRLSNHAGATRQDRVRGSEAAIESMVEQLRSDTRCVHVHRDLPVDPPRDFDDASVPAPYRELLAANGIEPWTHQLASLAHSSAGRNVVVSTPTASGKSLCYQIPALEAATRGGTSIVVYPTKALAHDQLASFAELAPTGVVVAAYDGDCSPAERSAVREHAHVVLTNPEMLHLGILANHRRWDRFLNHLELVAVDELHTLRGVFGSHVAHLMRRLRRMTHLRRGTEPCFVFSSATVGEPVALASAIAGTDVVGVERTGAPRGLRHTVLWNPFGAPGARPGGPNGASLGVETAAIAAASVAEGLRTLVFCRSRHGAELIANRVRSSLTARGHASAARVRTYRAGYLTEERREIELALEAGDLDCVVATNALELGIDVAGIDVSIMSGFPGTVAAFRQQSGRAGRAGGTSLSVLVAGQDQLDQWVMTHPREVFRRPPEPAVINPANPHVLMPHIACAADELPLTHSDERWWPDLLDDAVSSLVREDRLRVLGPDRTTAGNTDPEGPRAVWSGRGAPAPAVSLRSASPGEYRIRRRDGSPIGSLDAARVARSAHPGAVYLHQGTAWRIIEVDHSSCRAVAAPHDIDTYTSARSNTDISLLDVTDTTAVGRIQVSLGRVVVTTRVVAYEERSTDTHDLIGREPLEMEPSVLDTTAIWWNFSDEVVEGAGVGPDRLPGALHAAEHAGIGILPLFALCDRWDLGGVSTPWSSDTACATVVIHDAHPGGAGGAPTAFGAARPHLHATLEVLTGCGCATGCPSCVQSPKCGNGNEPLDRFAAIDLLGFALQEP